MKTAFLPGAVLALIGSTLATPAAAPIVAVPSPRAAPSARPSPPPGDLSLYSPRARRMVQTYLRLRLLQAREADVARVRAVIERRLGVDALFPEEPRPQVKRAGP